MLRRAFLPLVIAASVACGGDDGAPPSTTREPRTPAVAADDARLTQDVRQKLAGCALFGGGAADSRELFLDGYDRCYGRCALAASCEDLVAHTCDERKNAFTQCVASCPTAPVDGFVCASGARIAHVAVCDGEEDCRAGDDEADCAPQCADGTMLASEDLRCDGRPDCSDGSDELSCQRCAESGG